MPDPLFLPAGSLRHTITIQAPASVPDAFGQTSATWTTLLTARASIRSIAAKQLFQSGALSSQVSHEIVMRYAPGVKAGQRIASVSATYLIQAVENVLERNRVLKILTLEINGVS